MLWEVEIAGKLHDPERERVAAEVALLTHDGSAPPLARTARGYLLEGDIDQAAAQRLVDELLVDAVVETGRLSRVAATFPPLPPAWRGEREEETKEPRRRT